MSRLRTILPALLLLAAPGVLQGCGFQPLYAVTDDARGPGLAGVHLLQVAANDSAAPFVEEALRGRTGADATAAWDLMVDVDERADRLAVQIDASVTRYNYRLYGEYTLIERATGRKLKGRAESVASFNVVASQYSTLFAERTAREKAARTLVEEIERDILLKFAEEKAPA